MADPAINTYSSSDGQFTIEITGNAGPGSGQSNFNYTASGTPIGTLQVSNLHGSYQYVDNSGGSAGNYPFTVNFSIIKRPNEHPGFPYSIIHNWVGICVSSTEMLLAGSMTYLNSDGNQSTVNLGTLVFST